MPAKNTTKTRHHSNLRPKHRHTKDYLKAYWPYLPLISFLVMITAIISPWQANNSAVLQYSTEISQSELLEATNAHRNDNNVPELTLNDQLSQAAQSKATDMANNNYWSHTSPNGQEPWALIDEAGYDYHKTGENLAYGFVKNNDVLLGWMNSQSHRDNLLDPIYQEVGFGFANSANFNDAGPSTIVVAMYGTPADYTGAIDGTQPSEQLPTASIGNISPQVQSISRVQLMTNGIAPWMQYVVGLVFGAAMMYLLLKHSLALKTAIRNGERYAIKHPLLDITLVAFIVLCFLIIQQVGVVL